MRVLKSSPTARISGVFALLLIAALGTSFVLVSCSADEPTPTLTPPVATSVPPTATAVPPTPEPEEEAMEPSSDTTKIETLSTGDSIDLDAEPTAKAAGAGSPAAQTFTIGAGSKGLFKVDETLRGADVVVSLETEALSGVVDFSSDDASIAIDLHTLMSDQSRRDRYVRERMFPSQSVATVHFADLGDVPPDFLDSGAEHKTKLTGTVNVNGTDADLEFDITARLDNGSDLVVLGTSKFVWSDFGMTAPVSQFFTVEDEVTVEILLYASVEN